MKDFLGREIKAGNTVVYPSAAGFVHVDEPHPGVTNEGMERSAGSTRKVAGSR